MSKIILDKVNLHYPLYDVSANDFRLKLLKAATGGRIESGKDVSIHALNDITLEFNHGDRVAIVGGNGAGKSTFLRTVAGIYEPSSGQIKVEGKISTLLDITLGMNDELTGIQNIFCMSYVLGATKKQIETRMDKIIEFSELGNFVNIPVRTYSSGMRVRLAFSVISFMSSDILLIDEFFGAGDKKFIEKARKKMMELVENSSILLFVSHSKELVYEMCNKILILEKGKVKEFGDIKTLGPKYFNATKNKIGEK